MAKKMLFALLFCTLPITFPQVFAGNKAALPSDATLSSDECNAPPPDSFRVTDVSLNFISLAWKPVWIGAKHTIIVSEKNALDVWEIQETINNVSDPFYTLEGLESGKYFRITICTECISGEASTITLSLEERSKVIDLVIAGRMPSNPSSITDCHSIEYNNNEWTGFRIDCSVEGGVLTNFFEFENYIGAGNKISNGAEIRIKRVFYNSGIYAMNDDNIFPTNELPLVSTSSNKFKIGRLIEGSGFEIGGYIRVTLNYSAQTVDICAVDNLGWNNRYYFTLLKASSTMMAPPPKNGSRDAQISNFNDKNVPKVQSFVDQTLNIFNLQSLSGEKLTISLFGINGQIFFQNQLTSAPNDLSIPIEMIPAGLYFLRIDTNTGTQIFKVVKSE